MSWLPPAVSVFGLVTKKALLGRRPREGLSCDGEVNEKCYIIVSPFLSRVKYFLGKRLKSCDNLTISQVFKYLDLMRLPWHNTTRAQAHLLMISQICDDLNYIRKYHRSPKNRVWWYHMVWRPLIIPTKLEISQFDNPQISCTILASAGFVC